jgi:hypothetical protein
MLAPISLGGGSSPSRYGHEGQTRFINCYVEDVGPEGKIQFPLYAIDGLKDFATLGDTGTRAMLAVEESLISVTGRSIVSTDVSGVATTIGGIIGDGLVTMARNGAANTQIGIVADGLFKIIENGVVSTVDDADLPPANSIDHLNGYFLLTIDDGRIFSTELNDGDSIDGLDFTTANANPDGLVIGKTRGQDYCAFGPESTQFYQDVGGEAFPLGLTTSIDRGCLAAGSVVQVDETLAFVADDGTARILNGYQAVRFSNHAVERAIDDDANRQEITAISWQRRGHTFYAISGTNFTWVYDFATRRWHERESHDLPRWRCSTYARFQGRHLFGDYQSNKIYEGDPDTRTEAGESIVMTVQPPPVHAYPAKLRFNSVHVDAIPGEAANDANVHNTDPKMMLAYSEDGGHTWSAERQIAIGVLGQRRKRIVARRLGISKEDGRIFRFRVSADVVKGITGLAVDFDRLST